MLFIPWGLAHGSTILVIFACGAFIAVLLARRRQRGYALALAGLAALFGRECLAAAASLAPLLLRQPGGMPLMHFGALLSAVDLVNRLLLIVGVALITGALASLGASRPAAAAPAPAAGGAAQPAETGGSTALAGLAHLGILLNVLGALMALIIYLTQENRNSFTARHAKQALAYQVTVHLAAFAFGLLLALPALAALLMAPMSGAMHGAPLAALVFLPLAAAGALAGLAVVVYGVVGAVYAFAGRPFRYALIGRWVERW